MGYPFKRYCYGLAEKLGMTISQVMALPSNEISEWMAYDLTKDDKWIAKYNQDIELERQRGMTAQEKAELFKQLLGGA